MTPRRKFLCGIATTVLVTPLALSCGCAHRKSSPKPTRAPKKVKTAEGRKVVLPPPLAIPSDPILSIYLHHPESVESQMTWLQGLVPSVGALLEHALGSYLHHEHARHLANAVDPQKPWQCMIIDRNTEIWRLPVTAGRLPALRQYAQRLPAAGDFDARQLPAKQSASRAHAPRNPRTRAIAPAQSTAKGWLIWLGPNQDELIIAPNQRALVTALHLPVPAEPIELRVRPEQLPPVRQLDIPYRVDRVHATGSIEQLTGNIALMPGQSDPLAQFPIAPTPLSELLRSDDFVWGISSRWTDAGREVQKILSQVHRQVAALPFLIRGNGQALESKLIRTLKHWDHRTAAGLDAQQHGRLAFGLDNAPASEKDTIALIRGAVENISMIRNFTRDVPSLSFKRNHSNQNGQSIHEVIIGDARRHIPREFHRWIGSDQKLRIALSWNTAQSSLMACVGHKPVTQMKQWIAGNASSNRQNNFAHLDPRTTLLAARSAVDPRIVVRQLQQHGPSFPVLEWLSMTHGGPHSNYIMGLERQDPRNFKFELARDGA